MSSELIGAWEEGTDTSDALVVFSEGHACVMIMEKNRERFRDANDPTPVEALAAFQTISAQGGPYTASGNTLIWHRKYTRTPNSTGTDEHFEFVIRGDVLRIQEVMPDGTKGHEYVMKRVS